MNYLKPAWLEGLDNPNYRCTGRTERMIRLMVISICENEINKTANTFILCFTSLYETKRTYTQVEFMLEHVIKLKTLEYTKILMGDPEYFLKSQNVLFGIRIKESNIFIDHSVYEAMNDPIFGRNALKFFEVLKKITIPD